MFLVAEPVAKRYAGTNILVVLTCRAGVVRPSAGGNVEGRACGRGETLSGYA